MELQELEERMTMLEELIQGFVGRMNVVETEMPNFLKSFLQHYKETLEKIAARIETSNKRYDDQKIKQQMDELKKIVATVPKVIGVKNHHHFGLWSKSLIIGVAACFCLTAGSVGTSIYLYNQNNLLHSEAHNFWIVRALHPDIAKAIDKNLKDDYNGFSEHAKKAMEKQNAIIAAKAVADEAEQKRKEANDELEKVKAGK